MNGLDWKSLLDPSQPWTEALPELKAAKQLDQNNQLIDMMQGMEIQQGLRPLTVWDMLPEQIGPQARGAFALQPREHEVLSQPEAGPLSGLSRTSKEYGERIRMAEQPLVPNENLPEIRGRQAAGPRSGRMPAPALPMDPRFRYPFPDPRDNIWEQLLNQVPARNI